MIKILLMLLLTQLTACATMQQAAIQWQKDDPYRWSYLSSPLDREKAILYCSEEAVMRMKEKNAIYDSTRVALTLDCMRRLGWL